MVSVPWVCGGVPPTGCHLLKSQTPTGLWWPKAPDGWGGVGGGGWLRNVTQGVQPAACGGETPNQALGGCLPGARPEGRRGQSSA